MMAIGSPISSVSAISFYDHNLNEDKAKTDGMNLDHQLPAYNMNCHYLTIDVKPLHSQETQDVEAAGHPVTLLCHD